MTQGITTTTFGYTGDEDRLWQEVADARTTFALDLNMALPQVLAQQSPDQSTRYLPDIGQQVGAAWQYLHTDALGSIRHITGEDGSVAGSWRYSPFGQIEATNGDGSLFGYTGEPQDPASGLTYLRARYYHPALGRFLTPDAIVPDVLNGQAWNAYAYVYNDPINLVDPSGYAPWDGPVDRIREIAGNAWRSVKDGFGRANQWWNEEPECCTPGQSTRRLPNAMGVTTTLFIGAKTTPFESYGTLVTKERERIFGIFPSEWREVDRETEAYHKMKGRKPPKKLGGVILTKRESIFKQIDTTWHFEEGMRTVRGWRGLKAGLGYGLGIDMLIQGWDDWGLCLSNGERLMNILVAGAASLMAGGIGAGVYRGVARGLWRFSWAKAPATIFGVGATLFAANNTHSPIAQWKERHTKP